MVNGYGNTVTLEMIYAIFFISEAGCRSRLVLNFNYENENGYRVYENETEWL